MFASPTRWRPPTNTEGGARLPQHRLDARTQAVAADQQPLVEGWMVTAHRPVLRLGYREVTPLPRLDVTVDRAMTRGDPFHGPQQVVDVELRVSPSNHDSVASASPSS